MAFIESNSVPALLLAWTSVLAVVLVGIFAIVGIFDKVVRQRKRETDQIDDRLITLLKGEVDGLTRKIADYDSRMKELENKLNLYAHENEVLRNVMQGRDPNTVKMLQDMQKTGDYNAAALGRLIVLLEASLSSQGVKIPENSAPNLGNTSLPTTKVSRNRKS